MRQRVKGTNTLLTRPGFLDRVEVEIKTMDVIRSPMFPACCGLK